MTDAHSEARFLPAALDALAAFPVEAAEVELLQVAENVTWRVTGASGDRYVLRLHRPGYHTLEELVAERQWIRALAAAGIAVPQGVLTLQGEEYATVEVPATRDVRHAGLAHWTEGEVLERLVTQEGGGIDDPALLEAWFGQLGVLIAAMHDQASRWRAPSGFARHALDADGLMGPQPFWGRFWEHPSLSPAERGLLARARERLHAELAALPRTTDDWSLIHADLHPGNLLVHDGALAVIDFDDAGFGWHVYDLAVALRGYPDAPYFERNSAALLRGYRSRRPLSEAAAARIPMFILIRRLASLGWVMQRPELGEDPEREDLDELCRDVRDFLGG